MFETPLRVAVVGVGPRGTVALERICANAPVLAPGERVEIHVVDPYPAGGGRVWREEQDRGLLMNTAASDISVFTDDSVTCDGPITPGPTLMQWARMAAAGEIAGLERQTVDEAAAMQPWSYASRAFYGSYLNWSVRHIIDTAPAGVSVHVHQTRAIGLEDEPGGRQSLWLENESEPLLVDGVVLSQGHCDVNLSGTERELAEFADEHGLAYVPPAGPGEVDLSGIAAGEPVVLRGLGLNFFDYLVLLTVGRGGRFDRNDGRLVYHASGQEPLLYAGSGRGVPHTARGQAESEVASRYVPRFLTKEFIERLREGAYTGRNDFMADVWPHIAKEAEWVYYQHLLANDAEALARFRVEYPALTWGAPEMAALVEDLVPDPELRWSWAEQDRPADGLGFVDRADYLTWVREKLVRDHEQARLGPAGSAHKATAAMMRDMRPTVRLVVSHHGVSGDSYIHDVERWFSGLYNYIASGPPASRIEQLVALADAGVVRFVGPGIRVTKGDKEFLVDSPSVGERPVRVTTLIEARLPVTDVRRVTDPLQRYLRDSGQCRAHRIPNADGSEVETGGLDVAEFTFQVIDADGAAHASRFSYGPPIEGVQWVTATGARPYVNSKILLNGDVIARGLLTAAVAGLARQHEAVSAG